MTFARIQNFETIKIYPVVQRDLNTIYTERLLNSRKLIICIIESIVLIDFIFQYFCSHFDSCFSDKCNCVVYLSLSGFAKLPHSPHNKYAAIVIGWLCLSSVVFQGPCVHASCSNSRLINEFKISKE